MEDQTLNQRLYQLVAPHPSPYLSPSCKHGTILPPPQGSARCQLPHRSKVESSRPVPFVGRYDWPICWPQPHLWPNLFVGWNIWYVTSPSVIANAGFLMLQTYKQALQKRFFSLELCMRMKIQFFGPFWPTWKRCMICHLALKKWLWNIVPNAFPLPKKQLGAVADLLGEVPNANFSPTCRR